MLFNILKFWPEFDEHNCVFLVQQELELPLYLAILHSMEIFAPVYATFHNNFMLCGEGKEKGEKNLSYSFAWL